MAVLRPTDQSDAISYIGTLGIFVAISCTIAMLRFKGFKAVLNLSGKQKDASEVEGAASVSIRGAYRSNTDEFYEYGTLSQSPTSKITPEMVKLPPSQLRPAKSASDLAPPRTKAPPPPPQPATKLPPAKVTAPLPSAQSSAPPPPPAQSTANVKPQKIDKGKNPKKDKRKADKLDKEQKKRDKIAASEQAKQEKLRREREKQQAKQAKKRDTPQAPIPQPRNNPLANPTNTLKSSISKSSGPPPYDEVEKTRNDKDNSGNTSFAKPVEADSWELVSRHREQMLRPTANIGGGKSSQTVLDLQFHKLGPTSAGAGSEA